MKLITLLSLVFLTFPAYAKPNCDNNTTHPVYCHIIDLKPSIDTTFAMQLSNYISKYSKIYKTDPHRTVAIAMQENSFRNTSPNKEFLTKTTICQHNNPQQCVDQYSIAEGIQDIGLYQLNIGTIKGFNFDPIRVMNDLEYATECHFKILKNKMNKCSHLKEDSWTCYHSTTEKFRLKYKEMVNPYYKIFNKNN